MDKKETVKLFDSLEKSITYFRLMNDLRLIEGVIQNNQTTEVKSKWNIIGKASNKMKDSKANKFTEKKLELEKTIAKFERENADYYYKAYDDKKLDKIFNQLFKVDKYDLIKTLFSVYVLLEDDYSYEFDDDTVEELSKMLYGDESTMKENLDRMNKFYSSVASRWLGKVNPEWRTVYKEVCKNALVYFNTDNKKYLESDLDDFQTNKKANMIVYGLLFGLGLIDSVKLVPKDKDHIMDVNYDDLTNVLSVYALLITKARTKAAEKAFNEDLNIFLDMINYLRTVILKELLIGKKDVKLNQEKLALFDNLENQLVKEFDL